MTAQAENAGNPWGGRSPAALVEHDPVDVATGDSAVRDSATADRRQATVPADSDTATARQRHGDSDSATARQRQATATGDSDTTATATRDSGDSATATARQRHGDSDTAAGDSATATGATGDSGRRPDGGGAAEAGEQKRNEPQPGGRMRNRSFSFPDDLFARARSAMWHTRHLPGSPQTLSEYMRRAAEKQTRLLEEEHNDGQPFPPVGRLGPGPGAEGAARGAALRRERRDAAGEAADRPGES